MLWWHRECVCVPVCTYVLMSVEGQEELEPKVQVKLRVGVVNVLMCGVG